MCWFCTPNETLLPRSEETRPSYTRNSNCPRDCLILLRLRISEPRFIRTCDILPRMFSTMCRFTMVQLLPAFSRFYMPCWGHAPICCAPSNSKSALGRSYLLRSISPVFSLLASEALLSACLITSTSRKSLHPAAGHRFSGRVCCGRVFCFPGRSASGLYQV